MPVCKFCKKLITTDHYVICKQGSVCLECQDKVRMMLKGIVKNGGMENETVNYSFSIADSSKNTDGRLGKEVS